MDGGPLPPPIAPSILHLYPSFKLQYTYIVKGYYSVQYVCTTPSVQHTTTGRNIRFIIIQNALFQDNRWMEYWEQDTVGKGYTVAIQQALIHENPSTGTPDIHMCSSSITSNLVQGISPPKPNGLTSSFLYMVDVVHSYQ